MKEIDERYIKVSVEIPNDEDKDIPEKMTFEVPMSAGIDEWIHLFVAMCTKVTYGYTTILDAMKGYADAMYGVLDDWHKENFEFEDYNGEEEDGE